MKQTNTTLALTTHVWSIENELQACNSAEECRICTDKGIVRTSKGDKERNGNPGTQTTQGECRFSEPAANGTFRKPFRKLELEKRFSRFFRLGRFFFLLVRVSAAARILSASRLWSRARTDAGAV